MSLISKLNLPSQFTSLFSTFDSNLIYQNRSLRFTFTTIGALYVLTKMVSLAKCFLSSLKPAKDLIARYGKGTWVIVTGASDGIGKAFACELARRGFNIVLVGRSQEKLHVVADIIRISFPTVQTKIVVEDFAKAFEPGFAERIYDQVKDLDISILVNNAGTAITKRFQDIPNETIKEIISVNCLAHSLITNAVLPLLASKKHRSAILNVSSFTAYRPLPSVQLYSASKAFHDYLSRGLALELPDIDIISFKPATVSTNLTKFQKAGFESILPEQFVRSALRTLGTGVYETPGHWKHQRFHILLNSVPEILLERYLKKRYVRKPKSKAPVAENKAEV